MREVSRQAALEALARAIRGPRPVVARAFDDVLVAGRVAVSLEAIAGDVTSDVEAYARALQRADEAGCLKAFCEDLVRADAVESEVFARRARDLFGSNGIVPQGTVDPYTPSFDPDVDGSRKLQAAPQLCRIDIDGAPVGSGFLVKPHLVLTCYHVVSRLIENGREREGSEKRLRIVFDDRRGLRSNVLTLIPAVPVGVPQYWLVDSSHCHPLEALEVDADDEAYANEIDVDAGPWDYALIRLEKIANLACKGLPLGKLSGDNDEAIVVFHHPSGKSLIGTPGNVARLMGQGVRFKHTANTKGGSSGGPCFNSEYVVVGLHQAGGRKNGVLNRAVPIHPIQAKIVAKLQDPPPELKTILALNDGHVVIGRDDTQQWIWRAVPKDPPAQRGAGGRILVVKGSEGRGKEFTLDILRTLLAGGPHIIADLDAGNMIEDTPLTFVGKVLAALNVNAKELPRSNESLTTDLNWLKLTLMPAVRNAINGVRGDRTVWIAFRYPKDGVLPEGSKIRDALDAFYAQVGQVDWLRLVLLGLRVEVPDEVKGERTIENLKPLSGTEVATYFVRRWTELGVPSDRVTLASFANKIVRELGGDNEAPPAEYHEELAKEVVDLERSLAEALRTP